MTTPPVPPNSVNSAIPQPGFEQATTPQQVFSPSSVPSQVYAQPMPKKSMKPVVKIILASIGALLLFILVIIGYVGYQISKTIRQGAVASAEVNSGDLDIAEYPGSVRSTRKGATIKMNMPGGTSVVAAQYTTPDSPSQVVDFYKGKLGSAAGVTSLGDRTSLSLARANDTKTILIRAEENGGSTITITRRYSTP